MTCRTCALYDIAAVRDKAGRVRKDRAARCLWTMPEFAVPASLPEWGTRRLVPQLHMEPNDGENCPAWQERTED
jgi:hypothetical protein